MGNVLIEIATVVEVECNNSKNGADGLRIRAKLNQDGKVPTVNIPWAFPLLPKTLQSVPKIGEGVLVITDETGESTSAQRYYIGPLISQPQFFEHCDPKTGNSLLQASSTLPLEKISDNAMAVGSYPKSEDVAVIGRGQEDIILRYSSGSSKSEVDIRAGIRQKPYNDDNPNMIGNIIFNGADPAYIQLKYKNGLATGQKHPCSSSVNIVADYINIMSNYDWNISDNIHDRDELVKESNFDETINKLHQVPKGDKLVEFLELIKGAIMHHVHPWAGMEQCGDKPGYIDKLKNYDIQSILSEFVRVS